MCNRTTDVLFHSSVLDGRTCVSSNDWCTLFGVRPRYRH